MERGPVRTLFIVSADFGELVLALNFLDGQEFARESVVLLPDAHFRHNGNRLAVATRRYGSLNDILHAVDAHEPDIAFLFSGYMFSINGLLSSQGLTRLVEHLRRRGCHVVTSDPFIGLSSQLTLGDMDFRFMAANKPAPLRYALKRYMSLLDKNTKIAKITFLKIARIPLLLDLIHLYPAPTDHLNADDGVCRASFFNAEAVDGGKGLRTAAADDVSAVIGDPSGPPRWLFVLGSTDNGVQNLLHGKTRFTELLLQELLQRTVLAGRRPTLIGPASLIERIRLLSRKLPSLSKVDLLPFCPYPQFERLLLASEYVFYWNVFSGSSLLRIINGLPAFYFDRGHVSRWFPRFYEAGLRFYFSGWEPTFLDQRDSLDPGLLGELADKQRAMNSAVYAYARRAPTPQQVISRIMSGNHGTDSH